MSDELYTEPIIGYRVWNVPSEPLSLSGTVYTSFKWNEDSPTEAICMRSKHSMHIAEAAGKPHYECKRPPELKCNDGLFGFYTLETMKISGLPFTHSLNAVRGVCQGWGKVILHEEGYRAQFSQPIALLDETPDDLEKWIPQAYMFAYKPSKPINELFKLRNAKVKLVAEIYNIPIIPENDIEAYASQYGEMPNL